MRNIIKKSFIAVVIVVVIIGLVSFVLREKTEESVSRTPKQVVKPVAAWEKAGVPDFVAMKDVAAKKTAFLSYMRKLVDAANRDVLAQRKRLLSLSEKKTLSDQDRQWLEHLGSMYRVSGKPDAAWFAAMSEKVDAIPDSLAMAQAANESGWGTSRFAREGNNYFGQWCFSRGCGLVPQARNNGASHEVQKFDDPQDSVAAYLLNLNRLEQYQVLRDLRANARKNNLVVTGAYLAQGLWKYSERGYDYVNEIVYMINHNDLLKYDRNQALTNKG